MPDSTVGDAIRLARVFRGYSQRQLGALTDPPIHPARIFKIERGLTRIRPHELQALVDALDLQALRELLVRALEDVRA